MPSIVKRSNFEVSISNNISQSAGIVTLSPSLGRIPPGHWVALLQFLLVSRTGSTICGGIGQSPGRQGADEIDTLPNSVPDVMRRWIWCSTSVCHHSPVLLEARSSSSSSSKGLLHSISSSAYDSYFLLIVYS